MPLPTKCFLMHCFSPQHHRKVWGKKEVYKKFLPVFLFTYQALLWMAESLKSWLLSKFQLKHVRQNIKPESCSVLCKCLLTANKCGFKKLVHLNHTQTSLNRNHSVEIFLQNHLYHSQINRLTDGLPPHFKLYSRVQYFSFRHGYRQ